ncbi:carph-isopro domain-containing protein [Loktanella sp. 3ANDIMAR09]|uniref:carph-isopro domain-containing protein n=1 Tax=Loktanella sp. 3ANDIMAR09 TaxID=1225657 RepID=UPI0009F96E65|nr:YdaS family helix-turn-helix protein [Loktanella sp. 3ANDIMAR09]
MTPEQLISIWGDRTKLADAIGAGHTTVRAWFQRNSIPARYDPAIIKAAKKAGREVTPADLYSVRTKLASQATTGATQ